MTAAARQNPGRFRAFAILIAYALVFRLALPFAAAAPFVDFAGDPHALCLGAPQGGDVGEDAPTVPAGDHGACDLCCLATAVPAVAAPRPASDVAPLATIVLKTRLPDHAAIRGPPAEAWSPPRGQRGPPDIQ